MLNHRRLAGLVALCLVRASGDAWLLMRDPPRFVNHEEAYNATVGWLVWHTGEWSQLLDLQYRGFCGGCSVVAALAGPTLGAAGDHFLAWKMLAGAWALITLVMGFFALREIAGEAAGWTAAALLAIPPAGLSELGLMLWGNHQESALLLFTALALRRRPLVQALVLGLSVVFCRTSLYFVIVLLPMALRADWRAAASFAAGLSALLLPAAGGFDGQVPGLLSLSSNLAPEGIEGVLRRLALLFDPRDLGPRLFLARHSGLPALVALAVALVSTGVLLRRRQWLLPALALSFVLAFCVSGFNMPLPGKVLPIVNARYHAPWMLLLLLLPAACPGRWRSLAGLTLLVSLCARLLKDPAQPVSWETLVAARAAQPWSFMGLSRDRFDPQGVRSEEPRVQLLLQVLREDPPEGWNSVQQGLAGPPPPDGWGAGLAALQSCDGPAIDPVLDCLELQHLSEEALHGVGLGLARDWRDRGDLRAAIDRLGPAVATGAESPLAGIHRPVVPAR